MTNTSHGIGAQPTLIKEIAEIQIWPRKEWMKAEVKATILDAVSDEIEFILAVRAPEGNGKLEVQGVYQGEKACRYRLAKDRLYVEPVSAAPSTEIRIIYEGKPLQDSEDYLRQDETILRMDGNWLPVLSSTCADFDVTVRHPSDYTLFGQGTRDRSVQVDENWIDSRWTLQKSNGFTLYGGPEYATKETRVGSVDLVVALWPADIDLLEGVSRKATDIMRRITVHLGPYPFLTIRIVESGRNDGKSGYGPVSNVSIGYSMLREGIGDAMIAHEITHGWWGGLVPPSRESLYRGQWNETLAEYTSSWGLEPNEADELRRKWADGYASLEADLDRPLLEMGSFSAPHWKVNEAISYHKGALIMLELEGMIGLVVMKEVLAAFTERRRGKPSSWSHLLGAFGEVCGDEVSSWLKERLSA